MPPTTAETPGNLRNIGGSEHAALNSVLANQALRLIWTGADGTGATDKQVGAVLAALMEFKPTDGIEGMMAVQAVGLHHASIECLRRAMLPAQSFEAADRLRKQGADMTRAFLDVVAALDRKRGKVGQQVVRVERVMVGAGGQAVVGAVFAGRAGQQEGGGGYGRETEGEPHAPPAGLALDAAVGSILPPLRGTDPGVDPVPSAGDAQRSVPDARRP